MSSNVSHSQFGQGESTRRGSLSAPLDASQMHGHDAVVYLSRRAAMLPLRTRHLLAVL